MNDNLKIGIIGVILTILSFFIDNYFMSLIALMQSSIIISIFKIITLIGNVEVIIPLVIIITIIFYSRKKRITGIWAAAISTAIISSVLKLIINRPRPYEVAQISSIVNTTLSSFPSGHSMIAFCILPFLIKNYPKQKIYFWIIAILVAFSRIYLNVHYLSDVIAGAFIGYIIGNIFILIEDKYKWR